MNLLKDKLVGTYKEASELLKKGNPRGLRVLQSVLSSIIELIDDREILFHQAVICSLSSEWIAIQTTLKDGEKFLKELGVNLENIGKAFEENDIDSTNRLFRELVSSTRQRWLEARLLEMPE